MKQTIKKIIAIMLIVLILCTQNIVIYATDEEPSGDITVESARAQIVNWAINFKQSEGAKWIYKVDDPARGATYRGGYPQDTYIFECVGCVSYIIHSAIGIDYFAARTGVSGFVTPQRNVRDTTHFELHTISSSDMPQAGDVLIATKGVNGSTRDHVAIYCGNSRIVDIIRAKDTEIRSVTQNWQEIGHEECFFSKFARLKSVDGASFSPIEGGEMLPLPSENTGNNIHQGTANTDIVDLDEIAEKFKYQGMPTEINSSDEEDNIFVWFFNGLDGFGDYIAGAIMSLIRIPGVGLTSIVERTVSAELNKANG